MAKGWESKLVEEQQAANKRTSEGTVTKEEQRQATSDRGHAIRHRQTLEMQRELILSQRTAHPARRSALEAALKHVEAQLEALG
jgi:hypothetical protein